ncbi:MAG TPA: patatin-like phospholipase family protein, partial [Acidobacteriota bacterium]|nr:patatin-like phospholipase family protein [Acidobacteriota bacterium]
MAIADCSTALVLTGGGARAAYQAGVLKALAEKGQCRFPIITGVSAGAINATYLASVTEKPIESAQHLCEAWNDLQIEEVFRSDLSAIGRSLILWAWMLIRGSGGHTVPVRGIVDTTPLRNYLQRRIRTGGIQSNLEQGKLDALAISATNYHTGQTITFVHTKEEFQPWVRAGRRAVQAQITIDHVLASSALPIVFPAVPVNGVYYGDGSVRQTAPLSPAIHMGADRILAISVRYPRDPVEETEIQVHGYPPPAQILGMLMNSIFLDSLEADAERLRGTNQIISHYASSAQPP